MIYITVEDQLVKLIHNMPFDELHGLGKTREELELNGFFVDEVPEPELIEGKSSILYGDVTTKELWYEYEDIPLTTEEILIQRIADLEAALDILLGAEA